MDRVYESGAAAGAPSAPAAPSNGYPTAGNPGSGIEATKPGAYWFHMIMEELRAVITAAGIVPNHEDLGQLLEALQGGFGLAKSLTVPGYIELPGGLLVQWAEDTQGAGSSSKVSTFPMAFPTDCLMVIPIDTVGDPTVYLASWDPNATTASQAKFWFNQSSVAQGFAYVAIGH